MSYFVISRIQEPSVVKEEKETQGTGCWESITSSRNHHPRNSRIDPGKAYLGINRSRDGRSYRYYLTVGKGLTEKMGMGEPARADILLDKGNPYRIRVQRVTDPRVRSFAFIRNSLSPNSRIQFPMGWSHESMEMGTSPVEVEEVMDGSITINFQKAVTQHGYK